jgi:separase
LKDILSLYYRDMKNPKQNDLHLVLCLDKSLQCLPWESIPSLLGQPVSRVNSFEMLEECLAHNAVIETEKLTYLLNPSGDLIRTQERFAKLFER